MKIGTIEIKAVPVAGDAPHVVLAVKAGWFNNEITATPQQAREAAAELLQAANIAEGK